VIFFALPRVLLRAARGAPLSDGAVPDDRAAMLIGLGISALMSIGITVLAGILAGWNACSLLALSYLPINVALWLAAIATWRRLTHIAGSMEDVLEDPSDQQHVVHTVVRCGSRPAIWALNVCAALFGLLGFGLAHGIASDLRVTELQAVPYEIAVGWTVLLGTHTVYWIGVGLCWLWTMSLQASVRFDWVDPTVTPGLRNMYMIAQMVRWYCLGGLVLTLAPLAGVLRADHETGRAVASSATLRLILGGAALVASLVVVAAYAITPWRLAVMRRRDQQALLRRLRQHLPTTEALAAARPQVALEQLELYASVRSRHAIKVDREFFTTLILTLATVVGPILPLLIH
jgi:hypothetical protein